MYPKNSTKTPSGSMHQFWVTLPKLPLLNFSNLLKILWKREPDFNQAKSRTARLPRCHSTLKTNTLFALWNTKEQTQNTASCLKEHQKKSGPGAAIYSKKEEILKLTLTGKKNSKKSTLNLEKMEKEC